LVVADWILPSHWLKNLPFDWWIKAEKPVEKNRTSYQPGSEKETPLSLHQEKKCSTHQPVEGEKE
jgi:hypothetical protein